MGINWSEETEVTYHMTDLRSAFIEVYQLRDLGWCFKLKTLFSEFDSKNLQVFYLNADQAQKFSLQTLRNLLQEDLNKLNCFKA